MNKEEIKSWLIKMIAEEAGVQPEAVQTDVSFETFQLDSLSMITISYELEKLLDKEIDPTFFWQHDSIDKLADAVQQLA